MLFGSAATTAAHAASPFHQGINITRLFDSAQKNSTEIFAPWTHELSPAELSRLRAAGFDFIRLPVDPETCEIIPEICNKWLAWDPVVMAVTRGDGLAKLKALWIDCGDIDQYNLVYGARRLHRLLDRLGIKHEYEEFSDNHSSVDYRMDKSLPHLAKALS